MLPPVKSDSLEQARSYLDSLDLNYIVDAMCADSYALPRWLKADAQHCCQLYKNFLWLQKKYAPQAMVPTREIDEFWHNHILFTKNYFDDCLQLFGYYLHHEPSTPSDDPNVLIEQFLITKELYLSEFSQALTLIQPL
jgi:hypothetical protein